ncbi:MAG: sulfatase [Candidatus Aminicenantes bacterium]|nr:MAG: sulfatase [Candidatus Aminicenantes bacterium]
MKRKKVTPVLVLLLFPLIGLLQTCRENEYQYKFKYVDLVQFFPYFTKVFEEHTLKFVKRDLDRSKYILKGFKTYRDQLPRTWAVQKESTIITYFSHLEDKIVVLRCRPFNPPGHPSQEGDVFINGSYLKKIIFEKTGHYEFHLPVNLLHYGSNHMTFKWKYSRSPRDFGINNDKRKYAVGFSYLKFQSHSKKNKKRKTLSKIQLNQKSRVPGIQIPQGGIVEYFLDVPGKSQLRFRLSTRQKHLQDPVFHLAVYSETGKQIIRHFKNHQFSSSKEHQLNLSPLANQTVKIVFTNSIRNHPNFTVSLLNPAVYSPPGEGLLTRSDTEKGEPGTKKSREQKGTKKKPHVFIYLIDTLRADHMSCYGYSRKTTPYIDQFAKKGILFKNCFAAASWTKPAVGSILTGLYPNRHRGEDNEDRLSTEVETIAEVLKSNGYTTIYITPNIHISKLFNFDQGVDFHKFYDDGPLIKNFYYYSSEYLNSEFIEIIENNPELLNKPLFAYLHTIDPHDPYTPEEPFLEFKKKDKKRENLGIPDKIRLKKATKQGLSQEDIDYIKSLYDCEILHNDYYFGKFIDSLKQKNLYENSVIVVVADHGEQFDEHNRLFHGSSIYNEEIHVPLIIKFPHGEFSGMQTDIMVSQVDIFPTILDYLGIENSSDVDGISLFNILANNRFQRSLFVRERLNRDENHKNNFLGIINTGDRIKHIITYTDGFFIRALNMESYNLTEDFSEKRDILVEKPGGVRFKSIKFLADYFLQKMELLGFKKEEKVYLDTLPPDKIQQLRALGYIN